LLHAEVAEKKKWPRCAAQLAHRLRTDDPIGEAAATSLLEDDDDDDDAGLVSAFAAAQIIGGGSPAPPPPPSDIKRTCALCGRQSAAKLGCCGRCGRARYCSREHQRLDWPAHKALCKEWCAFRCDGFGA
jgi:hypothetical protein